MHLNRQSFTYTRAYTSIMNNIPTYMHACIHIHMYKHALIIYSYRQSFTYTNTHTSIMNDIPTYMHAHRYVQAYVNNTQL